MADDRKQQLQDCTLTYSGASVRVAINANGVLQLHATDCNLQGLSTQGPNYFAWAIADTESNDTRPADERPCGRCNHELHWHNGDTCTRTGCGCAGYREHGLPDSTTNPPVCDPLPAPCNPDQSCYDMGGRQAYIDIVHTVERMKGKRDDGGWIDRVDLIEALRRRLHA